VKFSLIYNLGRREYKFLNRLFCFFNVPLVQFMGGSTARAFAQTLVKKFGILVVGLGQK
jgi:hypothetical protein